MEILPLEKALIFCNQGIDGGEVISSDGLYHLDFSNYNIHIGKALRGKPLTGNFNDSKSRGYTLNSDGAVNGENALTLAQSKLICDSLREKCEGFIMTIHTANSNVGIKTVFIAKIEEGWEDPDTYIKKLSLDSTSANTISYVKKDVNYTEKAVSEDRINTISNKYINLPTCNWKSSDRCILRDYKYDKSGKCFPVTPNDGTQPYNVEDLKKYNQGEFVNWLNTLKNRDMGANKLTSEAANVIEYVNRCKDVDDYEFLSTVDTSNPYIPTTKRGDVRGRYVRISINNRDVTQNWLQLAEVEVISNNRNIAMSKPTSSSGNYPGSSNSKANDGNTDGNWNAGSVYLSGNGTLNNDGSPQFWEVDLGDTQTIDRIIISNRTDCCKDYLNNWLLTIYDNNKTLSWARIYKEHPNPKVIIDIKASENDINNIRIKDYSQSRFNNYFYRVSDTEFSSKGQQTGCNEQCHKEICEGEKKKWIGNSNFGCRDYKPGEWEAEQNTLINDELIQNLFGRKTNLTLLYKGSRDGFTAQAFHTKCDNQGATLTVIRATNGRIGGGYTPKSWHSFDGYIYVPPGEAFIFSVSGNSASKYYNNRLPWYSIGCHPRHGPIFGGGHDINVPNNSNSSSGHTNTPHSYDSPSNTSIFGSYNFTTSEIEVYKVECVTNNETNIKENSEGRYFTGSWIRSPVLITKESVNKYGVKVYIVLDDGYTKMVTAFGQGRYYKGPISNYRPCDWDTYNIAPDGAYRFQ
jgi:hypothetical protein